MQLTHEGLVDAHLEQLKIVSPKRSTQDRMNAPTKTLTRCRDQAFAMSAILQ